MGAPLSPRGAVVIGGFFIGSGLLTILLATGAIAAPPGGAHAPEWVRVCAGLVFIAAGLAIIVDYRLGRAGSDGQLAADTPFAVQAASLGLALSIVALMAAIAGWIAFGPGPRAFTSTLSLPFFVRRGHGELSGRIGFGIGAVLLFGMFVAFAVFGVRRLSQRWRERQGDRRSPSR